MWIGLEGVSKSYRGEDLFHDVDLQVNPGDRIAIIGANGCGKTTLLNILGGRIPPEGGSRRQKKDLEIGMIDQLPDYGDTTVYEAAKLSMSKLQEIEKRLDEIDQLLVTTKDADELDKILIEQEELMERFERLGGYTMEADLEKVLRGVGLKHEDFDKNVQDISGGEGRRLSFASVLLAHPDVLLLDEPTNHLDIEAIKWVENYLSEYDGAVVVVSHDRMFLDRVCKKTVEILGKGVNFFSGNYSFYLEERVQRFELAMKAYEAQQAEIARQEELIRRVHANPKLNVAQSRRRQLDKIERLEKPIPPPRGAKFRFANKNPKGNIAVQGKELSHYYGDQMLFDDLDLRLEPGECLAILGPNGAGKTTLMKIMARQLEPKEGQVIYGKTTTFGYFSQDRGDLDLDRTVLQTMQDAYPKEDRSNLQDFLALFLLGEEDWPKKVGQLSGGERSKLSLAILLYSEPNLLALDEPTNHLDIPTSKNLEDALKTFKGTLMFVSHDRYFINQLASRILYIKDGRVREYLGNYEYLEEKLAEEEELEQARRQAAQERKKKAQKQKDKSKKSSPPPPKNKKKKKKKNQKKKRWGSLQEVEKKIEKAEAQISDLTEKMNSAEVYKNQEMSQKLKREYDEVQSELEELYEYWEEIA